MRIGFTDDEVLRMRLFMERYHSISMEVESLKGKAAEIAHRISEENDRLTETRKEEEEFMEELHTKYGDFTVQDIADSIWKTGNC